MIELPELTLDQVRVIKHRMLVADAHQWVGWAVEVGGDNRGQVIEWFQTAIGRAVNEAWCMGFDQRLVGEVDRKFMLIYGYDPLPSQLYSGRKGEHVQSVWNMTPKHCRFDRPFPGALPIWRYYKWTLMGWKPTSRGHTGVATSHIQDGNFHTVEGNTSSKLYDREGDGVFAKLQPFADTKRRKLRGFLDPWALPPTDATPF